MKLFILFLICLLSSFVMMAQQKDSALSVADVKTSTTTKVSKIKIHYGTASYYADKFNGRKTANGEVYQHAKYTAACNVVPLGTWLRVTNLKNKRSVIVKVNDRLHPRMKRVVDLSRSSAEKLGYTKRGLTQVKVEVLGKKPPKEEQ